MGLVARQERHPEDVVAKLNDAMGKVMNSEEVQNKLLAMGYVPTLFSPTSMTRSSARSPMSCKALSTHWHGNRNS